MMSIRADVRDLFNRFAANGRQFLAIHLAVNVLVIVLLAPAATAALGAAVTLSGQPALSDEELLFFILSPLGLALFIVLLSGFSIIVFLEFAALIAAAWSTERRGAVSVGWILQVLVRQAPGLFRLAARVLTVVLVSSLPFVLALVLIHHWLLSDYDINYYIAFEPPAWRRALWLAAAVILAWGFVQFRLFVGWVFGIPLLLVRRATPAGALRASRDAVRGRWMRITGWLLGWLIASALLAVAASALVQAVGRIVIIPAVDAESMKALLLALGGVSLLGYAATFTVSFLSTSLLSLMIMKRFLELWPDAAEERAEEGAGAGTLPRYVNPRMLAVGVILAMPVSAYLARDLLGDISLVDRTEIMAHRGASLTAPENTLAAVQAAIDQGAHWVEIDVQEAADGTVVVIHDRDLKKIAGESIVVASAGYSALAQPDIGSWFDPAFSGERIPTLEQVLELCRDRARVNIELKYYGTTGRLAQRVAEIVDASGMADQVAVMSLSPEGIREMRQLRPHWNLGLLSSIAVGDLAGLDVDFLALNARFASRNLIRQLHRQGKEVMVWTVNDPLGMSVMMSRGVDAIITDDPALGVSVLRQREALEPSERLLMYLADLFQQPSLIKEQ